MPYQIGDLARITVEFRNVAGALIDPTGVSFLHTPPSGTAALPLVYGVDSAIVRDSLGLFHVDLSLGSAGLWRYQWVSTGTGQAAENGELFVESAALATWNLVSLEKAKRHLRIDNTDHDEDIANKVAQASAIVMDYLKLTAVPATWPTVPFVVEAAVLVVLGELFQKREAGDVDVISQGVQALLARQRDPALA